MACRHCRPRIAKLRAQLSELSLDELFSGVCSTSIRTRRATDRPQEPAARDPRPRDLSAHRQAGFRATLSADGAAASVRTATGVFLFRDRAELYERINRPGGKNVRRGRRGRSASAARMSARPRKRRWACAEIRALLAGEISEPECIAKIQQATRRYAKRQLTWFQRQTNFEPLNLSLHGSSEAIELIAQSARLAFRANG